MLKKFTNKKGFTLMEMLIVVAIIAVLVAIAIPTFSGTLKKANAATDLANIRSGYASAQIAAMTENHSAEATYYLQKDGTVLPSTDTSRNDYVCKAGSADAGTFGEIGGRLTVEWTKDDHITYVIKAGTNTVDSIASPTT